MLTVLAVYAHSMTSFTSTLKNASARLLLAFALITALLRADVEAQSSGIVTPTESQLDAIIAIAPDRPGAVAAVIHNGTIIAANAWGMADIANQVPFTVHTRSNIGSTSKQFTAFAILLLASENKLSLDDDVRRFIPELPDFGEKVTLRHLLTHSSGYREIFNTRQLAGHGLEAPFERSEILRIVQRQPALQNSPGREWSYNNTGYALLALVAERVTATSFPRWMQERVFMPIGMNDTLVRSTPDEPVSHGARGYLPVGNGYREARDLGAAQGAGAVYTTVGDLARWMGNFKSGAVGGRDLFARMSTPAMPTGFGKTDYGFGLYIDEWHGLRRIYHDGDDVAHHSAFYYFPDQDVGIVVETNDASFNAVRAAIRITECVFASHLAAQKSEEKLHPATFSPSQFDRFTGSYESGKTPGLIYTFSHDQDRLWVTVAGEKMEITFARDTRFRVKGQNVELKFSHEENFPAGSVTIFNRGEDNARRVTSLPAATIAPRDLTPYAGRYESAELETFYTFTVDGNTLMLTHPQFPQPVKLKPIAGERFTGNDPVASVVFERDAQGDVTGFRVGKGAGYEYIQFSKSPRVDPAP
ncbi:MAG: serine hydrolase domain-containing protein [Nibricoccus sp.]